MKKQQGVARRTVSVTFTMTQLSFVKRQHTSRRALQNFKTIKKTIEILAPALKTIEESDIEMELVKSNER